MSDQRLQRAQHRSHHITASLAAYWLGGCRPTGFRSSGLGWPMSPVIGAQDRPKRSLDISVNPQARPEDGQTVWRPEVSATGRTASPETPTEGRDGPTLDPRP